MTDEMTVEEAMQNVIEAFKTFDEQTPEAQAMLRGFLVTMGEKIAQADARMKERERASAARKQETAEERKKLRDELIPKWCEENLKPGMVVKVKANSLHKFRQIESITPGRVQYERFKIEGKLVGRHCHYDSRGQLIQDAYITDHVLRNVQGVVLSVDARGKPIVTSIMELIEGVNET